MTPMMVRGIRSTRPVWANSISCLETEMRRHKSQVDINTFELQKSCINAVRENRNYIESWIDHLFQWGFPLDKSVLFSPSLISFLNTSGSNPVTRMLVWYCPVSGRSSWNEKLYLLRRILFIVTLRPENQAPRRVWRWRRWSWPWLCPQSPCETSLTRTWHNRQK